MNIHKIASAIYLDVQGGLGGMTNTIAMSIDQLEDDVIDERLQIIKEFSVKNMVPIHDLQQSINCIQLDCESLNKCCKENVLRAKPVNHFQIPQTISDFGIGGISYIGSVDKLKSFYIYIDNNFKYHKYRRVGADKPYVYIDTTPNSNNMFDGYVFNAPLLKVLSVTAVFKDPRQVAEYDCCGGDEDNYSFIDNEIKRRLTMKKLQFYRQQLSPTTPNNQVAK